MQLDEFGLTSEDRDRQHRRKLVIEAQKRLPRVRLTWREVIRAWLWPWPGEKGKSHDLFSVCVGKGKRRGKV